MWKNGGKPYKNKTSKYTIPVLRIPGFEVPRGRNTRESLDQLNGANTKQGKCKITKRAHGGCQNPPFVHAVNNYSHCRR